jgi:hypothetical protein
MRSLLFWSALPFVLPQAMWVRARAPRFAGPAAAAEGLARPDAAAPTDAAAPLRLVGLGDSLIEGVGVTRAEDCRSTVRYEHRKGSAESLLAVPDAIAWCWAKGGEWN